MWYGQRKRHLSCTPRIRFLQLGRYSWYLCSFSGNWLWDVGGTGRWRWRWRLRHKQAADCAAALNNHAIAKEDSFLGAGASGFPPKDHFSLQSKLHCSSVQAGSVTIRGPSDLPQKKLSFMKLRRLPTPQSYSWRVLHEEPILALFVQGHVSPTSKTNISERI